jgi:hypothetical protein
LTKLLLFHIHKLFNPYPANVDKMVALTSASKWRMGFNSAFKGLKKWWCQLPEDGKLIAPKPVEAI